MEGYKFNLDVYRILGHLRIEFMGAPKLLLALLPLSLGSFVIWGQTSPNLDEAKAFSDGSFLASLKLNISSRISFCLLDLNVDESLTWWEVEDQWLGTDRTMGVINYNKPSFFKGNDHLVALLLIGIIAGIGALDRLRECLLTKLNFETGFGELLDVTSRWNSRNLNPA